MSLGLKELRLYRTWRVKHLALDDFWLYVKERRGDGEERYHIRPRLFSIENSTKVNRRTCVKAFPGRKTNTTSFLRLMMPQRCLCSHSEQLGQHEPAKCENSFNRNQSLPQISSPVPGGRGCQAGSPAIAQAWETQLSLLKGDRETKKKKRRSPVCICAAHLVDVYFLILNRNIEIIKWMNGMSSDYEYS